MPHSDALPRSGEEGEAGTPLQWFSKHPLVSTMLWVFGAQDGDQQKQQQVQQSRSNNRLSWVDQHGGQLNQYYGEEASAVRTSVQNGVYQALERKESEDRTTTGDSDDDQSQDPAFDDSFDTVSPQWGWYVSITPPQEVYAKTPSSNGSH